MKQNIILSYHNFGKATNIIIIYKVARSTPPTYSIVWRIDQKHVANNKQDCNWLIDWLIDHWTILLLHLQLLESQVHKLEYFPSSKWLSAGSNNPYHFGANKTKTQFFVLQQSKHKFEYHRFFEMGWKSLNVTWNWKKTPISAGKLFA